MGAKHQHPHQKSTTEDVLPEAVIGYKPSLQYLYTTRTLKVSKKKIAPDPSHSSHKLFKVRPSGRRVAVLLNQNLSPQKQLFFPICLWPYPQTERLSLTVPIHKHRHPCPPNLDTDLLPSARTNWIV